MKKPVIVLSARDSILPEFDIQVLGNTIEYAQFIAKSGGLPLTLLAESMEDAGQAASFADGLVITGGLDVNPALYHEENTASEVISEAVEQSDLFLYKAFREAGKPILGICRGIQIIAAAEGAKLIQDIRAEDGYENHSMWKIVPHLPKNAKLHTCSFAPGSVLYEIFGEEYEVNSYHHQALVSVPAGYKETARSADGIIEGMEADGVLAVQWHPERLIDDPKHLAIGERFIRMASAD